MLSVTARIRLLSPLFMNGDKPDSDDRRAPPAPSELRSDSICGLIRYWHRALTASMTDDLCSIQKLEAKVFGGAAVIQGMTQLNVGKQNVAFVERFLNDERIPIVSKDVLDIYPRKVCFLPKTGRAMVKKLAPATSTTVVREEITYRSRVKQKEPAGSVELF